MGVQHGMALGNAVGSSVRNVHAQATNKDKKLELMMKIMKFTTIVSTALMLSLSQGVFADTVTIKFGHVGGPGSLFEKSANEFARIANEKLKGKAEVVPYGSSQLGNDKQMLNKLKLGTLDLALPSSVMSSVAPEFSLFEMPYLIDDRAHMKKVQGSNIREKLYAAAEGKKLKILGIWENGFRQITNNTRPINTPEDLHGLKLRTPSGVWRVAMFKSYGANPAPMALSEVFVALQTGAMDGQENPLVQIYSQRFQEVQKYLSLSNHVYTPAYITAGASWKRLSKDIQDVLLETAKEVEAYALDQGQQLDDGLVQKMIDAGMEVNKADTRAFIAGSTDIYSKFGAEVSGGKEMLATVEQLKAN